MIGRPSQQNASGAGGRYPGGKNGAGVWQRIINMMPPHDCYIEPFVGSGAIVRRKRPAAQTIVMDMLPGVLADFDDAAGVTAICGDAISELPKVPMAPGRRTLIYADPPYVLSSRKGGALYEHEMSDDEHRSLLSVLTAIPAQVMISGYTNPIYDEVLAGWRRVDFWAMTRRGRALESVWCNFPEPAVPHDLACIGANFREREAIKRQQARMRAKFAAMPPAKRAAILAILVELDDSRSCHAENGDRIQTGDAVHIAGMGGGIPSPELAGGSQ